MSEGIRRLADLTGNTRDWEDGHKDTCLLIRRENTEVDQNDPEDTPQTVQGHSEGPEGDISGIGNPKSMSELGLGHP